MGTDAILQRPLFDVYDEGENAFVLIKPARFFSARLQRELETPAWFQTDFSTIPKLVRGLISVNERHRMAAVLHDLLYCWRFMGYRITRKEADLVLLDFCRLLKVPEWKCKVIYLAVRAGGWMYWGKKNKPVTVKPHHRAKYCKAHEPLFCQSA